MAHQRVDVVRPAVLVRLNEVGMLLRDVRRAHPEALQPRRLNEPSGRVVCGIGEHRAGVGPTGLVLATPSDDGAHRRPFLLDRTRPDGQLGRHHDLGRRHRGRPIAVGEAGDVVGAPGLTGQVDPVVANETRRHVRPVAPGVHAHCSTDRSRHADGPGQPAPSGVGHTTGQHRQRHRCPARTTTGAGSPDASALSDGDGSSMSANPPPRCSTTPPNPSSDTKRLEPRPRTKTGGGGATAARAGPRPGAPTPGCPDPRPRRAAPPPPDAVGGEGAQGLVPRSGGRPERRPGRAVHRRHHAVSTAITSVVRRAAGRAGRWRSPAPRVRHRSPGRSWAETV